MKYEVPEQSDVSILVYDINGNKINELYNGNQIVGYHSIVWNATNQPFRLCFVKMKIGCMKITIPDYYNFH